MGQIFVSYSRKDSEFADRVIRKLEAAGFNVWFDREGIQGGDQWMERIVNALDKSDAIVVVLSPNSVVSRNVGAEVSLAHEANKRIIPVVAKQATISARLRLQLAGIHRIDLESDFDAGCNKLVRALGGEKRKEDSPLGHAETSAPSGTAKYDQSVFCIVGTWQGYSPGVPFSVCSFKDDGKYFRGWGNLSGGGAVWVAVPGTYKVNLTAEPARLEMVVPAGVTPGVTPGVTLRALFRVIDTDTIQVQFSTKYWPSSIPEDAPIYKRKNWKVMP